MTTAEVTELDTKRGKTSPPGQVLGEAEVLARIAANHERAMYAAWIDIHRGEPQAAAQTLSWQLDGWDGPKWDGTETGLQYLTRTRRAAEARRPVILEPHPPVNPGAECAGRIGASQ